MNHRKTLLPALLLLPLAGILLLAARTADSRGRCVGMFLDANPGGPGSRLPHTVPTTGSNVVVRGTVPCMNSVMAWSPRGPYRVFEDGTVEFLAAPMPPCPDGDFYVWIAFPN